MLNGKSYSILVLTVLLMAAVCKPTYAELYKFTDEKGNVHITDNPGAVPEAQRPRASDTPDHERPGGKTRDTSGSAGRTGPGSPAETGKKSGHDAPVSSSSSKTLDDTSLTTNLRSSSTSSGLANLSKLPPEYKEQFKDVVDASSIPSEGSTASCTEFKSGLNKDIDKIMQAIRELAEEKKKGGLGLLDKAKGIWTLKSVAWVAYRMMNGQEQCVKEFGKENEKRFEDMTKEINKLTEEVKDK